MGKATGREGTVHRVYLSPEREGALQAYREDKAERGGGVLPPVNGILLDLLVDFLEREGYLPRGTMNLNLRRPPRTIIREKGEGDDSSD